MLVAVSGGADSTALLLGLARLGPEFGYQLGAAHLDHGLRGLEAARDRRFVARLCAALGVPLESARWNTRERMRRRGLSGQDGLRRLRREFLERAARRLGAAVIATAHTADDQLETLLMRLARGAGLEGLGGIGARRGIWIRPLLAASRFEIEADLRAIRQSWREDASNADLRYERNRVRHQLVSAWLEATRGGDSARARSRLAKRVAATLSEVRAACDWLDRRARRARARAQAKGGPAGFDRETLRALPTPVLRRALVLIWSAHSAASGLTLRVVDDLVSLVKSKEPRQVSLPQGLLARASRRGLRIEPVLESIQAGGHEAARPSRLRVPGRNKLGDHHLQASWVDGAKARRSLLGKQAGELFAASQLEGVLELRPGRTDEWFMPFGRRRARRLGDFLKQSGVSSAERKARMVLADRQGILWVIGLRRSARAPLTPTTRKALWIRART